ncbi:precorrin-6y C5,15-methyltransferase (decarboxylating) subunit CbiE [Intestinibacillus massiliensis]|nr:precorrin-6y C5,15-methyltransferase (decarboxylating) subunit CbiE [Intestinibacillus massiliensis]
MGRCFQIIGAGLGDESHLTLEAREAICGAGAVFATARLADGLRSLRPDIAVQPIGRLAQAARSASADPVAVLVSGDVGFFSAARRLREQLLPYGTVRLFCGQSSLQYFCAKIGSTYDDAILASLHGRQGSLLGPVSYHGKVFALTGGEHTAQTICRELADAGLGAIQVHLGENLGAPEEYIASADAQFFAQRTCADLAVLLIENAQAADCTQPVYDRDLLRGKVPMTKEEIRWVSVSKLGVHPADTVYDIGAGTGSVAFELARRAHSGIVYAVERKPEAVELLIQNRARLGGYNVKIVEAAAPQGLDALPAPDAAFIGGSGGNLHEILCLLKHKNPAVRVVINAIALETLQEAMAAMGSLDFANVEIIQVAAARGNAVGKYTMMTANNPVFIISGGGKYGS